MPPNGLMTMTATPSSSASGSSRASDSRSPGFSGSWTTSNRPVRSARSSSPNEPALQCVTPMRSMRPAAFSSSSHGRCSSHATRLWHLLDLDAAEEPPLRLVLRRVPPRRSAPRSSSRRSPPRGAHARLRRATPSAAPYIGDESKTSPSARERRVDDRVGRGDVALERPVRAEPDHGAEATLAPRLAAARARPRRARA